VRAAAAIRTGGWSGQFSVAGLSQNGQGDEKAGQSCESYPAPCRPRLGRPTHRRTELIGHVRGSSLKCSGTFITNARYWIGPVSGDPPSSPVSSIRSTKPCFPRSGAFRWNHHGHFRFAYRVLRFAPLWVGAGRGGPGYTTSPGPFCKAWLDALIGLFPPSATSSPRRSR